MSSPLTQRLVGIVSQQLQQTLGQLTVETGRVVNAALANCEKEASKEARKTALADLWKLRSSLPEGERKVVEKFMQKYQGHFGAALS